VRPPHSRAAPSRRFPPTAGARGRRGGPPEPRKVKVVANLPYNITKEFLKIMLPMGDLVSELSIMIQVGQGQGHHTARA